MRLKSKITVSVVLLVTLLFSLFTVCSVAAGGSTVYLTPNDNWRSDNARFAVYTWNDAGEYQWIDMTDSDGNGIYQATLPAGYLNLIFCRMDPNKQNGWSDNKCWNQTNDFVFDGTNNHYVMSSSAWNKGEGKWTVYDANACAHSYGADSKCTKCGEELFYIIAGYVYKNGETYAQGDNTTLFGSKWDVSDENNKMEYDPNLGCYVKVYENVAKGEYAFKVAENKSWDVSYGDNGGNFHLIVEEDGSTVVITFKDGKVTYASSRSVAPDENPEEKPEDPTIDKNPPVQRLNFFQKIWLAITNFFKRLFGRG